jgi:hypothetical protein
MLAKYITQPKVSFMGELDGEKPQVDLGTAIRQAFGELLDANQQIIDLTAARDAKLSAIADRIIKERDDIPEEERFVAQALLSSSMKNKSPEAILQGIDFWQNLDDKIKARAGETIAWLDAEETTVSHRTPGHNVMDFRYYFNLGVLPHNAQLDSSMGYNRVLIKRAARMAFWYDLDEELNWEMGVGDTWHFTGQPELVERPVLWLVETGIFPHRATTIPLVARPPLPIIGNEAVAEILDKHGLSEMPDVQAVASLLKESLAA